MNKTELELKKDQLISSSLALSRLQMLHRTMSDSLKYMRKIVNFMIFDTDVNNPKEYSSLDEERSINQLQKSIEMSELRQSHQEPEVSQEQTVDNFTANFHESGSMTNDKLVKVHQFELIEVLLTWLLEFFQKSKTPTHELQRVIQIVQQKADPKKCQEIRRTFLSDARIHHAQHMFKLNEKVMSLEAERKQLQSQLGQLDTHNTRRLTTKSLPPGEKGPDGA